MVHVHLSDAKTYTLKGEGGLPCWLLANAGDKGSIPATRRSHMLLSYHVHVLQQLSLYSRDGAATTEPTCPWSPCSSTKEATAMRSPSTKLESSLHINKNPAQPKINKIIFFLFFLKRGRRRDLRYISVSLLEHTPRPYTSGMLGIANQC